MPSGKIEQENNTTPVTESTITESGLEVFDFEPKKEEVVKEEPKEVVEEYNPTFTNEEYSSMNDININAHNKFFTPIQDNIQEIKTEEKDLIIDPMANVDKLSESNRELHNEKMDMGLKDAIVSVRNCIEELGNKGFYIGVEEIDFTNSYQITININKDN